MNESIVKDEEKNSEPAEAGQDLPEAQDEIAPAPSIGTQIAARREALGLTMERVAEQLKMTPRQILAIESDNQSSFHSQAIYRGFVRAYAKVLKMDTETLMSLLPNDAPNLNRLTPVRKSVPTPFSESRAPFKPGRNTHAMWMMVAIGTVIVLIAVLMAQKMGWLPALPKSIAQKFERSPASAPASVAASAVVAKPDSSPASASAPVDGNEKTRQIELPAVDVSSQLASPQTAAPAAAPASDGASAAPVAPEGAVATPVVAAVSSGNALVIKCREESWIELRRANGSVLYKGIIPAGGSETIEITEPLQLTLGNGPGVDASLRGAPLEIPVDKYSKVVRLSLK